MSNLQEDDIKRWTAKRKSALVLDIIQGKATVAEASRQFDLPPAEIEEWRTPCEPSQKMSASSTSVSSKN